MTEEQIHCCMNEIQGAVNLARMNSWTNLRTLACELLNSRQARGAPLGEVYKTPDKAPTPPPEGKAAAGQSF